jgi:PAS domain S-box-containing protein
VTVPLVFQLVIIGSIQELSREEEVADQRFVHSKLVEQQAQLVLTLLVDAQTGSRGYALTENPVLTEPLDRATQALPKQFAALKDLVRDNPRQFAEVESIEKIAAEKLAFHLENVQLVRAGDRAAAVARIGDLAGKHRMDQLRRQFANFLVAEQALDDERRQTLDQLRVTMQRVINFGMGASLVLAMGLAVAFTRGVSRRLNALTVNSQNLAKGQPLLPPIGGNDEIAALDQAFREMAQSLAQSREEISKHARMLESMLDNMGDGVAVVDEAGKFLVFNPAAERILGVGATSATQHDWSEHFGTFLADQKTLCPTEQLPLVRAMRGEAVDGAELFVRKPGASEGAWITVTARPLKDAHGRACGGVAVFQDVSQRRRNEREMQRALRMVDGTRDGIFMFEPKSLRFSYVNQGAIEQVGYSRSELLQMTPLDIKPEFDEPRFRKMLEPLLSRAVPSATFTTLHRHKSGLVVPVEINLQCLTDAADSQSLIAVVRDITERKRAEEVARQNEQRIRELNESLEKRVIERTRDLEAERRYSEILLNSVGDGLYGLDLAGQVVFINPAGARTLGYAVEELIGQPMHAKCHHTYADGRPFPREDCPIYAAMRDGQIHRHSDDVMWRKDGTLVSIEYTSTPLRDEQGRVTGAVVVFRDITERKQSESLSRAKESAESANRAKSEFLASMSHELRTPLNGILGMNELLLNTELTARQRQFVEACSTSGKALLHQINDILDLSKIEAGKLELDLHQCRLEALVYDVADVFSHTALKKGFPLHCHIDPAACVTAMCDGNRLRQVLVNLIGNAMKFTSSGGVKIRAERTHVDGSQMRLRVSVSDSGIGIPADRIDKLFSPFTQVDGTTTRKFGGTGLGLSICKQLVELMGGQIGVESQVGVGSTFWFEVPLTLVVQPDDALQERHVLAGRRVLAVDGIDRDRKQIGDCLLAWECPFEQAATLSDALEFVARAEAAGTPFDVALADCRLVEGDEYVLLQKLAKMPRLPIVGVGTNPSDETIAYLQELGVRHVLRDPVRPSALFNALASVLSVFVSRRTDDQAPIADEDTAPLSGQLLVAEDNFINQMFIVELLSHCGCTCDVTNNGDEALRAVQQKRYDLVLMDCQMPEMDGFAATREIRRREAAGQLSGRIPIVALTANALQGDRELCLEAGMDDYLTKPLNAKQLRAMLVRHLPTQTPK